MIYAQKINYSLICNSVAFIQKCEKLSENKTLQKYQKQDFFDKLRTNTVFRLKKSVKLKT